MNLLIIDDEYYIVQGLVSMVDHEATGIDRVFTAYSAEQGRKILQREQIDLLLLDIQMPRETGLELLEQLRRDGISVTTMILSGHQRFDYALEAIRYHCFNYLLKPIGKQSLNYELSQAAEFVRSKSALPKNDEAADMKPKESLFITSVRDYIREHFSDADLNRTKIADAMHLNPDYLSYSFHKEFGSTLTAYITSVRMDQAKYLLKNTTLPVHHVAEQVGIPNISYFYKQFKKASGTTPQLYRG